MDYAGLHDLLVRRLRAHGAGHEDAEDCAQEAVIAVWSAMAAGHCPDDLVAWTTQVARRRYTDIVRREVRRRKRPVVTEEHDRTMPTLEQRIVERDHASWLASRLTALPAATQAVCESARAGHRRAGIAARLGVSLSSTDSHLTRARRFIRGQAALAWAAISAGGWCLARKQPVTAAAAAAAVTVVVAVFPVEQDTFEAERLPVIDRSTGEVMVTPTSGTGEAFGYLKSPGRQELRPVTARREPASDAGLPAPAPARVRVSEPVAPPSIVPRSMVPRSMLKGITRPLVVRPDVSDLVAGPTSSAPAIPTVPSTG